MKDNRLFRNSSFSVLQTIVVSAAAIVLFKLMVTHLGLKAVGIWSFLSSITAITGFGSFGFANALVFYIPRYKINKKDRDISSLVNTSFFSIFGLTVLLCIVCYFVFSYIIPLTVEKESIDTAKKLLPLVLLSFLLSGVSSAYLSVLDGLMIMETRAKINIAGAIIFLTAGYLLLLKMGITGVSVAQILQNLFLIAASYSAVKKNIPSYQFSFRVNKTVFREIFRYGFNFQVISLTQVISEPFLKSMITKYAGSESTAIFDFCIKLLSVFRSLIIAANQAVVPQIAAFKTLGYRHRISVYYKTNLKLNLFLSLIFFLCPVVLADAVSLFFLNKTSSDFNFIFFNVAAGLFINALAFPAHFHNLGTGHLKWNVINNTIAALIILIFSPLLGEFAGGKYVILSWSFAALVGPSILIAVFNRENNVSFFSLFTPKIIQLIIALSGSFILCRYLNSLPSIHDSLYLLTAVDLSVLALFLFYPVITNPVVKKLKLKIISPLTG